MGNRLIKLNWLLVSWLVGWLVGLLAGWLFACLAGWLFACLAGWLVGCLLVWLVGGMGGGWYIVTIHKRTRNILVSNALQFFTEQITDL